MSAAVQPYIGSCSCAVWDEPWLLVVCGSAHSSWLLLLWLTCCFLCVGNRGCWAIIQRQSRHVQPGGVPCRGVAPAISGLLAARLAISELGDCWLVSDHSCSGTALSRVAKVSPLLVICHQPLQHSQRLSTGALYDTEQSMQLRSPD